MKKILPTLLAAVAMTLPALAEDLVTASGDVSATASNSVAYHWAYRSDVKTDLDYEVYPNWNITYTPALTETPTSVTLHYVLTKEGSDTPVWDNTLDGGKDTNAIHMWTGPLSALGDGNFTLRCTFSVTFPDGEPQTSEFVIPFESTAAPVKEYDIEFVQTSTPTANSITIEYEFKDKNNKVIPDDATFHFEPGISGFPNQIKTEKSGTVTFDELQPNTKYTIWSNNPYVIIDGVKYTINYGNWDVTTLDGVSTVPTAKLTYEIINAQPDNHIGYFSYNIVLENLDDATDISYRVWLDAAGNITKGESTTQEGQISVDVPENGISLWVKGQVTYTLNGETKTINTNPNDVECHWVIDTNTAVEAVEVEANKVDVYNAAGVCVRRGISKAEINNLPAGLYIVNGKKFIVK